MCGIAGAFSISGENGAPLSRAALERMTHVIEHRGPDDAGFVLEDGIALGARRLSIIDVEGGHQPMASEDGAIWGAQNGELYNHGDIRRELGDRGHKFRTRCDTEILPHLYEEYGPKLCERLRGKFGIAVYDTKARRGVIARDRLGIKPLYYAQVGDRLLFGSELKCIIASGLVGPEIELEAMAAYLTLGFIPAPLTPLKGVRKLLPGERLIVGDGRVVVERYWEYPVAPATPEKLSDEEAAGRLLESLEESVVSRLMSDVPLGAMLSGGLDSSVIVALMARHMSEPVKTFAVGFEGAGEGNELPAARRVAAHYGADHHELELAPQTDHETLATLAWHMDEPLADLSSLGFHALCGLAAKHVTVALSGQGADELLGGYHRHVAASLAGHWTRVPGPLRTAAIAIGKRGPARGRALATSLAAPDPGARMLGAIGLLNPDLAREFYAGPLARYSDAAAQAAAAHLGPVANSSPLDAALHLEAQLGLADDRLHYFDRASMAWSLEVRVPFLDHHVVEACVALPARAKVHGPERKRALRLAAEGIVPGFVLSRPKRGFFSDSVTTWLSAERGALVDRLLLDGEPGSAAVVDPSAIRRVVAEWRGGNTRNARAVLALVMLELWFKEFLPRAFAEANGPEVKAA
jgi:asparagine synthase (glutamine-hydrolysing)